MREVSAGEGAANHVCVVRGAVEHRAGDSIEEVQAYDDAIDRFDVCGEERLVLDEVGGRHGIEVRRRCGIAHVERAGRVDEALFEAFEREGAVLEIVQRNEDKVVLEHDAVKDIDLACGKERNGGIESGGLPHGDGRGGWKAVAAGVICGRCRGR